MKVYEKPTLEVNKFFVEENLANGEDPMLQETLYSLSGGILSN